MSDMTAGPAHVGRLQLHRVDAENWVVQDHAVASSDPRHVVACVHQTEDDDVEVVWVHREIPLPRRYRDAIDVLDDLARWRAGQTGMTRPIEIPHLPPIGR